MSTKDKVLDGIRRLAVSLARYAGADRAIAGYLRISAGRSRPRFGLDVGRVTLIGDAAHPMQPIGSQAGSQAVLDARLLTAALIETSNPVEALQHYDATRRPVMNDITLRNRSFGPEAAMQLVEERAPNGFVRIEDVISRHELDSIANSFAAAAGLDVETVNKGHPFVRPG